MKNGIRITVCVIAVILLATGCERGSSTAGDVSQAQGNTAAPAGDISQRKILHYRNPMGQSDTSPTPKKDPMGMDYIPVYSDEKL